MHLILYVLVSLAAVVAADNNNTYPTACVQLASVLVNQVFFPEATVYNASIFSYPFLQLRQHPDCIVRPKTAHDVSTTLAVLRDNDHTRFAVRGGGHNANAGFNNIDKGITIDMQSLNAVDIARGDQVIRVGSGSLWQNVYDTAEKRNLTALGGRIGVVGTAGFLTGGGVAFYSPEYGWACDAVVNFEVVLANGDIVNANATSNPDLFAALKGGQSNFGIVTRFDLKAYPARRIWGGRIVYAPEAADDLLTAFTNFKTGPYDPYVAGWTTIRYNHSAALFNPVTIMWYTKLSQKPGALKGIIDVKPQVLNGMIEAPISEHTRNASRQVVASPRRTIWATTSFHISPTIVHKVHKIWRNMVPAISETYAYAYPSAELTFQSLPAPPRNGSAPNSLGFSPQETPEKDLVFLQIVFTFDDASAMQALDNGLKTLIEAVEELTKDEGVYHPYKYLNFAAWFQDPLGSYGKEHKSALREVARKYDPSRFFQKQLAGGFKLL